MWLTGPAAPRHVGSSQTRARTRVPCIGRRILNHCTTREAPAAFLTSVWRPYLSTSILLPFPQQSLTLLSWVPPAQAPPGLLCTPACSSSTWTLLDGSGECVGRVHPSLFIARFSSHAFSIPHAHVEFQRDQSVH